MDTRDSGVAIFFAIFFGLPNLLTQMGESALMTELIDSSHSHH